jgi:integrase
VEFLRKTPREDRLGPVFPITALTTDQAMTPKRVGRVISEIGKKANIIVNKAESKFASAQDLRRSFGTRWAKRVKPATLQLLMRHRSIETTMKYYVHLTADDVADELWHSYTEETARGSRRTENAGKNEK